MSPGAVRMGDRSGAFCCPGAGQQLFTETLTVFLLPSTCPRMALCGTLRLVYKALTCVKTRAGTRWHRLRFVHTDSPIPTSPKVRPTIRKVERGVTAALTASEIVSPQGVDAPHGL